MTNPLSTIDGTKWIGDGAEGAKLVVTGGDAGSTVELASARRGTPYNVRLACDGDPPPSLFFEVELAAFDGSLGVGLVTAAEFQPGWKARGMFYNGNLTNGSAGLRMGFGPRPRAGDRVGVCLRRDGAACRVAFSLNGRGLGVGFAVESAAALYPCLHVDGAATVRYSAPSALPETDERQPATFDDPYSGDWRLKQAFTGPELHQMPTPEGSKVVLNFELVDGAYRLTIKVANTFRCILKITGKMENFDKIEVGSVMSTKMMPPEELQPLENFVTNASTFYKMIISSEGGEGNLILTGPAAEMICTRLDDAEANSSGPLTAYL